MPVLPVGLFEDVLHLGKRHRGHIGVELHQLIAVALGKNVRVQGHDLAELDVGRPELFQNRAELFRGDAARDMVLPEHLTDLCQPLAVLLAVLASLLFFLLPCLLPLELFSVLFAVKCHKLQQAREHRCLQRGGAPYPFLTQKLLHDIQLLPF